MKLNFLLGVVSCLFLCAGCETIPIKDEELASWKAGKFSAYEAEAAKRVEKKSGKNAIIHRLDYAAAFQAVDKCVESNNTFDEADKLLTEQEAKPKVSLINEIGSMLLNPTSSPYQGRASDGIMVNTYKALNFLRHTNIDNARVELNRAVQRQIDAVEINRKRIEAVQEKLDKDTSKEQVTNTTDNAGFKAAMDAEYKALDTLKPYGVYENPFTVYLDGLFFMAQSAGAGDLERSRKSFERASTFAPENPYLKQDLQAMESVSAGTPVPPTTYIIFETGTAPALHEKKIQIPTFGKIAGFVPIAFPVPELNDDYIPALSVMANGKTENTALLASMDRVVGLEFKQEIPTVIRKTLMSTAPKVTALVVARDSGNLYARLAADIALQLFTRADCRSWSTLPKEFQICRVPTPADRKIQIGVPGRAMTNITVAEGHFNIVHVRSTSARCPLQISQIPLK